MQRWPRRLLIGCAIGAASAALAWAAGQTAFFKTVELKTYDYRVRMTADPASARRDIVLVSIDDSSIRRLEPHVGPLAVAARGPRVPDRLPRPRPGEGHRLRRALHRTPAGDVQRRRRHLDRRRVGPRAGVVGGARRQRRLRGRRDRRRDWPSSTIARRRRLRAGQPFPADPAFEARPGVILPYDELTDAAAAVGHNFSIYDADGPVRRTAPFVRVGDVGVPSLAVAAVMLAGPVTPEAIRRENDALQRGAARWRRSWPRAFRASTSPRRAPSGC